MEVLMSKMNTVLGWHILRDSGTLGYGDGREVVIGKRMRARSIPVGGVWFGDPGCAPSVKRVRSPKLCGPGMHASSSLLDALSWAQSMRRQDQEPCYICRVEVYGVPPSGVEKTKFVGLSRKVLWAVRPNWKERRHLWALFNRDAHGEARKYIYELKRKKGILSGSLAR